MKQIELFISTCTLFHQPSQDNTVGYLKTMQGQYIYNFIYCNRGSFRCGKISQKCCQNLSCWDNFHNTSHISLIKSYGFSFLGGNFREGNIVKNAKITPTRKLPCLQCMYINIFIMFFFSYFVTCFSSLH